MFWIVWIVFVFFFVEVMVFVEWGSVSAQVLGVFIVADIGVKWFVRPFSKKSKLSLSLGQ